MNLDSYAEAVRYVAITTPDVVALRVHQLQLRVGVAGEEA